MDLKHKTTDANPRQVLAGWLHCPDQLASASAVLRASRSFRAATLASMDALSPAPAARRFGALVESYESGRWTDAYADSALLADSGDPGAAKLALLMLRYGALLYGVSFQAEPRQIARWAKLVLSTTAAIKQSTQREPRSTSRRTASPSSITAIA